MSAITKNRKFGKKSLKEEKPWVTAFTVEHV
jgi:hypothetical protein